MIACLTQRNKTQNTIDAKSNEICNTHELPSSSDNVPHKAEEDGENEGVVHGSGSKKRGVGKGDALLGLLPGEYVAGDQLTGVGCQRGDEEGDVERRNVDVPISQTEGDLV